jgi:hypothetical protein
MEKRNKAAQIYGYAVCVVAVITFIIAVAALVTSIIDMRNPLYSGYQNETNLASFENYKVEAMKSITADAAYIPDDSTLQTMYEAAKSDLISRTTHRVRRNIIVNSLLLGICVILFFVHWKWIVRL